MPDRDPYAGPDLQEVLDRNLTAHHLIATFARSATTLDALWRQVTAALNDTPELVEEIRRLRRETMAVRLSRANYLAAIKAALSAHTDGEADPLAYLRHELDYQATAPRRKGRA